MKHFFRGILVVAALISALILIASCGKETVYVVEKTVAPETTVEVPSNGGGYSSSSGNSPSFDEEQYISGIDELMGQTLDLPSDQLITVGYGVCAALRSGQPIESLYADMIGAVGPDPDLDFLTAIMSSAIYWLCPDQMYQVDNITT